MDQWELRRKTTSERIFSKIREEMPQPIGIVMFGADCDFKTKAQSVMVKELQNFALIYDCIPDYGNNGVDILAGWQRDFREHHAVVMTLEGADSYKAELRRALICLMRDGGARTVIGFYIKPKIPKPLLGRGFLKAEVAELKSTIEAIEASSPEKDDLDYLAVFTEKDD